MKKVVILLMILFVPGVFAQDLASKIKVRLIQIEKNLYQRDGLNKQKYCKDIEIFYNRLLEGIRVYGEKYPKRKVLLNLLYQVAVKRFQENKKNCLVHIKSYSKVKLRGDFYLHSLVDKNEVLKYKKLNDNWYLNPQISLQSFALNKINKAREIYKNYVKIGSSWYYLDSYSYAEVLQEDLDNILLNIDHYLTKADADYLIYGSYNDKYKAFLVSKSHIKSLSCFNPKFSLQKNASLVSKIGGLYIGKFFYVNNEQGLALGGLIQLGNNLFFFVPKQKMISYSPLNKNFDLFYAVLERKYPILLNYDGKIYAFPKDTFNFYYIGPVKLYEKVNLQKLGHILFPSFYRISVGNYSYKPVYMYDLLLTATRFDGKRLSDVWDWIVKNFKYEDKISNLINSKGSNQEKLNEYLKQHPSLVENWIVFYTLKARKGVCQTLSDIFSIIALLNGLDATVIDGYIMSADFFHQVSKVGQYYYDVTYGLINKNFSYFGMTNTDLNKYFKY